MNKKDLLIKLHGYVASDGGIYSMKVKDMHGKKIRIRRRLRTKFFNKNDVLINDFLDTFNIIYPNIKSIRYYKKRIEIEIRNHTVSKEILSLGKVWSRNWEIPKNITNNQKRLWVRAFADGEGTVYNKNHNRYVAIDSINLNGLKEISTILQEWNIIHKIYGVKWNNYQSYRLRIYRKENLIKFNKLIGFTHPEKQQKLNETIYSYKH